ncbi:hypothetical protein VPH35_114943 [Triticum aestivum]
MGNGASGSHQYSGASNNPPNQQGQGHAHSGFNSNQPGASIGPASAGNDGSQLTCYKCENPGHAGKDCQTVLFCANCAKYSHPSRECSFLSRPKPVASLVGSAADGLQMFSARTGKKLEPDENRDAIAIVTVKNANLTVSQWGEWEWMARPYIRDSFLVKFPSVEKIDEMKGFDSFRLIATSADIKVVDRWTNSSAAAFKLYVCWVRITGVPETLEHYRGFCEAGSLIGSVLELDMELYGQSGVLRAKIGVMDPRKIPSSAPLNESGFIFNIHFELEDIVEEGGILVSHPSGPESSHNITEKRPREQSNREDAGCSKSSKHVTGAGKSDKGNTTVSAEDVIPSQYELDKNLVAENEVRQKLLDKKRDAERSLSGVEQVNAEFANSAAMLEDFTEVSDSQKGEEFDCTQDADDFARRLGSSTQKVKEINANVEIKKQKMREAEARVQRAKDKAALDEAARRRSDKHKNKDEGQTMDKATEMVKKKNLEMAPAIRC